MNDTIVIFDRIRENLKTMRKGSLEALMNVSVNQTLSRTALTSGLTFLTCIALYMFGGPVLHGFSFALVAGIIVGTYSSVFIASPIVLFWNNFLESRKKVAVAAPAGKTRKRISIMFEQTFVEGTGKTNKPWTVAVSFILQIFMITGRHPDPSDLYGHAAEDDVDQLPGGPSASSSSASSASRCSR